jgi:3-oxoacid CoA-transferase subunit A
MINRVLITGDTHREFNRFKNYDKEIQKDSNTAVIILGDAGINVTNDEHDNQIKNFLTKRFNFRIYCVRGNHELRPQDVSGMKLVYDEDVNSEVYMQDKWPTLRYFKDWGIYTINGYKIAVIGGAYSVDKYYRLQRGSFWNESELLTEEEMLQCTVDLTNQKVDFVFTHTCPICWEPYDLFLNGIDQSKVDKTMELFLEEVGQCFEWKIWAFGHYHADRLERPYVEQFFKDTEDIKVLWDRWQKYNPKDNDSLDWWLEKSQMFYDTDILLEDKV